MRLQAYPASLVAFSIALPGVAFADAAAVQAATFDFTALAVSVVGGAFSVIGIVATAMINGHLKDRQAAATLSNAVANSLGDVQNAIEAGLKSHPLQATIPGISAPLAAGVQYVMDHAGDEAARFGVTPAAIADKIGAKIGLGNIPAPPVATPATARIASVVATAPNA